MIRSSILALAMSAMLVGCGSIPKPPTPEPIIKTVEVKVPVPVKCQVDIGPDPDYPDSKEALLAAPNIFEQAKLLVAGRLLRIKRDLVKTAALQKCTE